MAGKRGLVFVCKRDSCLWKGEKAQALNHFAKKHCEVETAPFSCSLCTFTCGTSAAIEKHVMTPKHIKKAEPKKEPQKYIRRARDEEALRQKEFSQLDQEESRQYWLNIQGINRSRSNSVERTEFSGLGELSKEELIRKITEMSGKGDAVETVKSVPTPAPAQTISSEETKKAVDSITETDGETAKSKTGEPEEDTEETTTDQVTENTIFGYISDSPPSSPEQTRTDKRQRETSVESDHEEYTDWKRQKRPDFDIVDTGLEKEDERLTEVDQRTAVLKEMRDIFAMSQEQMRQHSVLILNAFTGISDQLRVTNNLLINQTKEMQQRDERIIELLKTQKDRNTESALIRKELSAQTQSNCLTQNSLVDLGKSVRELSTNIKVSAARKEAETVAINSTLSTFGSTLTDLYKGSRPVVQPSMLKNLEKIQPSNLDKDHLRTEFEREWAEEERATERGRKEWNGNRHHYRAISRKSVERSKVTLNKKTYRDRR